MPDITFPRRAIKKQLSATGYEAAIGGPESRLWELNGSASLAGKILTLTVVNPHLTEAHPTQVILRGSASAVAAEGEVLGGVDLHTHNTLSNQILW